MRHEKDPVCGMMVNVSTAPARKTYEGKEYYFCSTDCERKFTENPGRYTAAAIAEREITDTSGVAREGGSAPFTKSGGIVAPKFGSAGSGGAEYEPIPEPPDKAS